MATTAFTLPVPAPALTPVQEQVITLLSAGLAPRKIAEAVKIHRTTIGHWRRSNPAFAEALAAAQYDRILHWHSEAEEHADLAIYTIGRIIQDHHAPASVRLRAALAMLQHATTLPPPCPAAIVQPENLHNLAQMPTPVLQPEPPQEMHNSAQPPTPAGPKPGRNAPCSCGSGHKYKLCCLLHPLAQAS
jgi:hypothetical protein